MTATKALTLYTGAFIDELVRSGVTEAVISPGSRSTPISMLMAEHPDLNVWLEIDERSAGFFALGMAKAKRKPVALVCTSGTAAANYMPAVVEAYLSRVPLVVLTTDRPHELRDVGAPQAIDQLNLFGKYAKWFVEMALPEETENMIRYARSFAGRAVATSFKAPAGVVHLNFPFREPLVPDFSLDNLWEAGRTSRESQVKAFHGKAAVDDAYIAEIAELLDRTEKGLIVCGPHDEPGFAEAVSLLASTLKYPILADPLSQLRGGTHEKALILETYDAFLRDEEVTSSYIPEVIIRFGAMPVSKSYLLYQKKFPEVRQFVIDEDGGWRDPTLMTTDMIHADSIAFCEALTNACENNRSEKDGEWLSSWIKLNEVSKDMLVTHVEKEHLFEGKIVTELIRLLPDGAGLFVGNSMPVRDLDTFYMNSDLNIRTMANRGANGIDGVVSSALGAATIHDPLVLLIGDLSFYHDMNGLLATKLHKLNATIVLVNNDGGGIFSFLPQAQHPKHFESLFGTATGLDFSHVVKMYGGSFGRVSSWDEFRSQVQSGIQSEGLSVVEVPTDRGLNAEEHRDIWKKISEEIRKLGIGGSGR